MERRHKLSSWRAVDLLTDEARAALWTDETPLGAAHTPVIACIGRHSPCYFYIALQDERPAGCPGRGWDLMGATRGFEGAGNMAPGRGELSSSAPPFSLLRSAWYSKAGNSI